MSVADDQRDERFMRLALAEAVKGLGTTRPNPMVGAVIVRGDEVVAVGHHARAGGDHAEVVALKSAGDTARGAEMFVNLEPCSHHGRTPPCVDALIAAGVRRVVAGMIDPNPQVSGRGMRVLEQAGVETRVRVLENECLRLNRGFIVHIGEGRPFVTAKVAMSADGRIATRTGDSKWISNEASRSYVHELRAEHDAILVGTGTLLADDPRLTTRIEGRPDAPHAHRYAIDPRLDVRMDAAILDVSVAPTTILCAPGASSARRAQLVKYGVEVVELPQDERGGMAVSDIVAAVAQRDHLTLLVEGGGETLGRFADAGVIDELVAFHAPVLLGGTDAKAAVGGEGVAEVAVARRASYTTVFRFGDDVCITSGFRNDTGQKRD